jgi:hypothetical protein
MFKFDILEVDDFNVANKGVKTIYNIDGQKNYLDIIKDKTKINGVKSNLPQMYGSVNFRDNGKGVFYDDSLGYFVCEGDTVESNPSSVFIISGPSYRNRGVNINKSNFLYITSYFSARKSISCDWKNQKDSYIFNESQISDENLYDTIVYSLFNSSSSQCAVSSIIIKDVEYKIKNEFFWISSNQMKELGDTKGYDLLYNDARISQDRYVYKLLFGEERLYDRLSNDAKKVLNKATELVNNSIEIRQNIANDENNLNSWDAGYAQLKELWKEYFPNEFKEFRELYKKLENKMKERTYNLEFLK